MSGSPSLCQSWLLEPRCVVVCQQRRHRDGAVALLVTVTLAFGASLRRRGSKVNSVDSHRGGTRWGRHHRHPRYRRRFPSCSCRVFVLCLVSWLRLFMYRDGVFVSCPIIVSRVVSWWRVLVSCPPVMRLLCHVDVVCACRVSCHVLLFWLCCSIVSSCRVSCLSCLSCPPCSCCVFV